MVDLETGKCPHDCGISGNFLFFSPLSRICLPAALALFITLLFFFCGGDVLSWSWQNPRRRRGTLSASCVVIAMGAPKGDNMAAPSNVGTVSMWSRLCGDTSARPRTWPISPKRRQRISSGKPRARRAQMTRALVQPLQWHSASYSHRFPKWKKEDGQLALMPLHMLRGQEPFRLIRPDRSGVWLLR